VGIAYVALVVVYVIICFFLIMVVLLQQGKGADIAGAFGGGGTQTAFGARGATTVLQKMTTVAFSAFILIALALTVLQARPKSSVLRSAPAPAAAPQKAPASAAPQAPAPAAPQAPGSQSPAQPQPPTK
jgi:preprotein translocase subunit SecG